MCGRFTRQYTWEQLHALYKLSVGGSNLQPRYNIAPTTTIDVVMDRGGKRELMPMRWGLIPSWWKKKANEIPATFNARAETVATKPMFRSSFRKKRCLIPVSGYYEWMKMPDGKQPFYFTAANSEVLTIAGLWDEWSDIESGRPIKSCTMIVTDANEFARKVHDRMPVFLAPDEFQSWLNGKAGEEILKPATNNLLQMWPVSRRVNKSGNDEDGTLTKKLAL